MNARRIEAGLWAMTALLIVIAGFGFRSHSTDRERGGFPFAPVSGAASPRVPGADLRAAAVEHDPFRFERHPSPVAYRPELEGVIPPPPPPKPPKPQLVLAGILGGPPWDALIEGIPDHTGTVLVHEGNVISGLKMRSIRKDSVIIEGADTTWRLGLKRSWQ